MCKVPLYRAFSLLAHWVNSRVIQELNIEQYKLKKELTFFVDRMFHPVVSHSAV